MSRNTDRMKAASVPPDPTPIPQPATCYRPCLIIVSTALGLLTLTTPLRVAAQTQWVEQGPGPILNGQVEKIGTNNPVAGGINAIAVDTANPDILYAGAVNGGIWKTTNGTQTSPTWEPLTDDKLPALSIKSLALSPVNPGEIFAGTGSTSNFSEVGNPGFGVAYSKDAGANWVVLAGKTFKGRVINSIIPTRLEGGKVVLTATGEPSGGVWRSVNTGVDFELISGKATLPGGGVSSLVADPINPEFFYAALPSSTIATSGDEGVYLSDNGGVKWMKTSLTGLKGSSRILLAVSKGTGVVYAMILNNKNLKQVSRSPDHGVTWTDMGAPKSPIFTGGQTSTNGAIAADPIDANVVFVAGDAQDLPNPNGCKDFTANIFRGDASVLPGNPWECVVCNGAQGSSPHADSRTLVFDTGDNLLQGCDGGMDRLLSPNDPATRVWADLNGNVRTTEMHSVAYDPVSNVVFSGNQDVGTSFETALGNFAWDTLTSGDGGVVAVDADQVAHFGTSIRYTSFHEFIDFNRTTWDAANSMEGNPKPVRLKITAGPGRGKTLKAFEGSNILFYQPYVLNAIEPTRMLIATTTIYESMDQGDSVTNLNVKSDSGLDTTALAYGSRLNGVDQPDVFYVGAGTTVWHRVRLGGEITSLDAYPGDNVVSLAMSPEDYKFVVVVDNRGRVWSSPNEGATWSDLTDNLPRLTDNSALVSSNVRAVVVLVDQTKKTRILVAGQNGVFEATDTAGGEWVQLKPGLPHALFWDLHFDNTNDVLVVSSIGRGAWTLSGVFKGGLASSRIPTPRTINAPLRLPTMPSHPPIAAPLRK